MRFLIQRVSQASVTVEGEEISAIKHGLLVFFAFGTEDTEEIFAKSIDKIVNLRVFPDDKHPINASVSDIDGEILLVSQFTLFASTKKGRRPSFTKAMEPEKAQILSEKFVSEFKNSFKNTKTGQFQTMMEVKLINDGPVTIMIDTDEW